VLSNQMADADKRARAHIVIDTKDSNLSPLRSQVA
jgi:hypothetical protein